MLFLEPRQLYFSEKKKNPWQKLKDYWLGVVVGIWGSNLVSSVVP